MHLYMILNYDFLLENYIHLLKRAQSQAKKLTFTNWWWWMIVFIMQVSTHSKIYSLFRAICGRIESTVQGLPPPYRLNRPQMSLTTSSEVRRPLKAPNFSVNWTIGQNKPEVVNTLTGKTEQGEQSRICKASLFKRFEHLLGKLTTITSFNENKSMMYSNAKDAVETYNVSGLIHLTRVTEKLYAKTKLFLHFWIPCWILEYFYTYLGRINCYRNIKV